MYNLDSSILKTIVWFDIFDFPLTAWEIHKYLYIPEKDTICLNEIEDALNSSQLLSASVSSKEGFYFLSGREKNITTRKQHYILAERKFVKALKIIRFLRLIPWIKMISVCNSLGFSNAPDDSDIDLFVITEKKRVWITRFFVVSFLKILGLRPLLKRFGNYPEIRRNTIDTNFFLSEDCLNIKDLTIENDIYLTYWTTWQTPVYNPDNYYEKFTKANNWIKNSIPNTITYNPSHRRRIKKILGRHTKPTNPLVTNSLINLLESLARRLQLKILPQHLKELANKNTNVIITDSMLKFHDQDRRVYYRDLWLEKLK